MAAWQRLMEMDRRLVTDAMVAGVLMAGDMSRSDSSHSLDSLEQENRADFREDLRRPHLSSSPSLSSPARIG